MTQYKIESMEDVREFFRQVIEVHNCLLHPDDSFEDMVDTEGQQVFSQEDAANLDGVMNKCFEVCDDNEADIYEVAIQVDEECTNREAQQIAQHIKTMKP